MLFRVLQVAIVMTLSSVACMRPVVAADANYTFQLMVRRGIAVIQGNGPGVGFVVKSTSTDSWIVTANHVVVFNAPNPNVTVLRVGDMIFGGSGAAPIPSVIPIAPTPGTNPARDAALMQIHVGHLPCICMAQMLPPDPPAPPEAVAVGTYAPLYLAPGMIDSSIQAAQRAAPVAIAGNGPLFGSDPKHGTISFQAASEIANSGSPVFTVSTGLVVSMLTDDVQNLAQQSTASNNLVEGGMAAPSLSLLNRSGPTVLSIHHFLDAVLPQVPYTGPAGNNFYRAYPDMDVAGRILMIGIAKAGPSYGTMYSLNNGSLGAAIHTLIPGALVTYRQFDSQDNALHDMGAVVNRECRANHNAAAVSIRLEAVPPQHSPDGRRHLHATPTLWDCVGFPLGEGTLIDTPTDSAGMAPRAFAANLRSEIAALANGSDADSTITTPSPHAGDRLSTFSYSSIPIADDERRTFTRVFIDHGTIKVEPSWIKGAFSQQLHVRHLDGGGALQLIAVDNNPVSAGSDPRMLQNQIDTPDADEVHLTVGTAQGTVTLAVPSQDRCRYFATRAYEDAQGLLKGPGGPYYDYRF